MNKFLIVFLSILISFGISNTAVAAYQIEELPKCVVMTHCVRENFPVKDIEKSFNRALEIVSNTPRTKIIEQNDTYIHAESKTKWRRYTDDFLVKAIPEKGYIQVRSESRVGVGDNGVNKKRVDRFAYQLKNITP